MLNYEMICGVIRECILKLNSIALRKRRDIQFKDGKHYFIDSGYVALGRNYENHCRHAQLLNRKDSLKDVPSELIYAHTLLLGVIAWILEEHSEKPIPEEDAIKRQFVLIVAFIQGIIICEQSILQGLYLQAGNLIRQEYEIIGLLTEIKKGKRRDGKVANARNAPWNGSELYGPLSTLAHLSNHKLLEVIIGYNTTWGDYSSALPQYREDKTIGFYSLHVGLVLNLVQYYLIPLWAEICSYKSDERQRAVLTTVTGILMKHQFITMPIMVSDLDKSTNFYERVLNVAGYKILVGSANDEATFVLENKKNNFGNVVIKKGSGGVSKSGHIIIEVSNTEAVKRFYNISLSVGGKDGGRPRQYPEYGEGYYGAFIFDPDGNKIGVATHSK